MNKKGKLQWSDRIFFTVLGIIAAIYIYKMLTGSA
jgi:hypothetical protein